MPEDLREFMSTLAYQHKSDFASPYLSVKQLEYGLLRTELSQENNATIGKRGFGNYAGYWVVQV